MKKLVQIEKKMADFISKIGVDKVLHFLVGFAFTLAGFMYGLGFSASPAGWGGWACVIIVALSFIKEKFIDEKFDFTDVLATFAGAMLAIILYVPIDAF